MPELPEVEIVVRGLSKRILGNVIQSVVVSGKRMRIAAPHDFAKRIEFSSIIKVYRIAKYILVELENAISGTSHQFEDATSTIEHILPENPSSVWEPAFPADEQDDYIYLIGNYTLLEESLNKKADGKSFAEKLPFYKASNYRLSKEELNYTEWNPIILRKHQDKMARWACTAWKSNFIQNK
jgi:hypothetical protein